MKKATLRVHPGSSGARVAGRRLDFPDRLSFEFEGDGVMVVLRDVSPEVWDEAWPMVGELYAAAEVDLELLKSWALPLGALAPHKEGKRSGMAVAAAHGMRLQVTRISSDDRSSPLARHEDVQVAHAWLVENLEA